MKKIIVTTVILLFLIGATIIGSYIYLKSKLGNMNYSPIDKDGIGINTRLYDEIQVSSKLSQGEFKEIQNFVFFGSDSRVVDDMEAGRSDTIMICSINPKTKSIKLISIPRDTYVNIPDYYKDKINHAYAFGKEQLSLRTINENFGLNIDKYVTIDFSGLIDVINKVGGIELEIDKDEMNYINSGVKRLKAYSSGPITKLNEYGKVKLTGEQALTHSRNRTTGQANDFGRADRQRQVVAALMAKIASTPYNDVLDLSDDLLKAVKTNITSDEYIRIFSGLLISKDQYIKNIITTQIPSASYASGKMINGVYYFVSDIDKAKQDFIDYIFNR